MDISSVLTREQREAGLAVYEDNAYILLTRGKEVLQAWLSAKVRDKLVIQMEAQKYLARKINSTGRARVAVK